MDTKEKLEKSLHEAMKSGDNTRKNSIRMALTNIKLAEVEKGGHLDEAAVISILQKEIKSRRESIADAQKANRSDLIQSSEEEIKIFEEFLPKQISPEELKTLAQTVINELQASKPSDMGKVMKEMLARTQGQASGDQISQVVRGLLQK